MSLRARKDAPYTAEKVLSSTEKHRTAGCHAYRCVAHRSSMGDCLGLRSSTANSEAPRMGCAVSVCKELAALAVRALLDEASLSPKPGLVDPVSTGAHSDMDFALLVKSATCLEQGFYECALIGFESPAGVGFESLAGDSHDEIPVLPVREKLQRVGLALEKTMFAQTGGVNTHKGAIFIFAYLLAAAGRLCAASVQDCVRAHDHAAVRKADKDACVACALCTEVRTLAAGISASERAQLGAKRAYTHGEQMYLLYGCTGIRGAVEAGLPLVRRYSSYLTQLISPVAHRHNRTAHRHNRPIRSPAAAPEASYRRMTQKDAYLYTLLGIISENEDTNVLFRAGMGALHELQTRSAALIAKKLSGAALYKAVRELDRYCIEQHISPGGAADLFAAVLFCRSLASLYNS